MTLQNSMDVEVPIKVSLLLEQQAARTKIELARELTASILAIVNGEWSEDDYLTKQAELLGFSASLGKVLNHGEEQTKA